MYTTKEKQLFRGTKEKSELDVFQLHEYALGDNEAGLGRNGDYKT